jgi:hypothetical protein
LHNYFFHVEKIFIKLWSRFLVQTNSNIIGLGFCWLHSLYLKRISFYFYMPWLRLFFASFCICGETNTTRCLVTNQTAFYAVGTTKKLSLKCSFCASIFTCFLNWVLWKLLTCLFLRFKRVFEKINFFYIFLFFKLIFFCGIRSFWCTDIKKIKIKEYYFNAFLSKKYFKKQSQLHSQTQLPNILYMFFATHKLQP